MTIMLKTCTVCNKPFETKAYTKTICSPECRVRSYIPNTSKDVCWEWPNSINPTTGYGQLSDWVGGKRLLLTAHRVSFKAHLGEIPQGMQVCHTCDNRKCFNPNHLFLGSQKDNMVDMWKKGRGKHVSPKVAWQHANPEKVPRGENHHLKKDSSCLPRGEKHPQAKIDADIVKYIRQSSEKGVVLSKQFNISGAAISAIRKNKIWKHVP